VKPERGICLDATAVLGTGCAKCAKLYDLTAQAARELGQEYELQKVTDLRQIGESHSQPGTDTGLGTEVLDPGLLVAWS
jgi:hypothetical protein